VVLRVRSLRVRASGQDHRGLPPFLAQVVATFYIQATWIDLTRTFYFEKMVGGVLFLGDCCSA